MSAAFAVALVALAPLRAPPPRCCAAPESFVGAYDGQLPSWLTERAAALGFEAPTSVQAAALPPVLGRGLHRIDEGHQGDAEHPLRPIHPSDPGGPSGRRRRFCRLLFRECANLFE